MDARRVEEARMKRIVAIGAVVVVLLAAGWSLFWWLGRDALVRGFDAEVARLEAAGWSVDWAERELGGFPFGYTIRLTALEVAEPTSGFAVRLPHATVENEGVDGVLVRLPETFAADLPLTSPQGAGAEPELVSTTGESSGLVLRLAGTGPERRVGVEAQSLTWRLQMPGSPREQALSFEGLAADMASGGAETALRLQAARYGVDAALAEADGPPSTMTASYRDVTMTGSTTVPTLGVLAEMLYAGAPGQVDLALQAGPADVRLVGGEGERRGTLDWQGDAIGTIAKLSSGRMELEGEARQNVWTLVPETPGVMVGGRLSAGRVQATYSMPMAPAPEPDDMAIGLSLSDVTLDESAWQAIDPEGALPREPAALTVDLGGLARVTRRIDAMRAGDAPPYEIRQLELREVSLDALGATARATGSVEVLQPINFPLGGVEVSMTGVSALVGALGRAGVLSPEQVEMADAILTVYARPAEGKDAWTTEISFTNDGPLVNGLPIR
jgi:hypothetical protein